MDLEKTVFFISPIGRRDSIERQHSDMLIAEVLRPVAEEFCMKVVRADEIAEDPEKIEEIYNYIAHSKVLLADLYGTNANVLHEIGIALAWGIAPIYIAPESINGLPFDIRHQTYIPYEDEIDGTRNAHILQKLRTSLKTKIQRALDSPDMLVYKRAQLYVQQNGDLIHKLEQLQKGIGAKVEETEFALGKKVDRMDNDLGGKLEAIKDEVDNVFSHIVKGEQSFNAVFIDGEEPAFAALTDAINRAQLSVKTTRFSPYSVVGRHDEFFSAVQSATGRLRSGLFRILAVNSPEKLKEAIQLVSNNVGKNLTIVFTKIEYSFEIVVIDDEEAFIHFRRADRQEILIASTLHVREKKVASEFSVIFDQIVKTNSVKTVDCNKIRNENVGDVISEITRFFSQPKEDMDVK